jgi:glycosyltransferase involved in cell wall biosynthesis
VFFDESAALAAISDVDVLHIQFESSIYYRQWMLPFIDKVRAMGIRVLVTVHSCLWPEMYGRAHRFISHSPELAKQLSGIYLPMPIPVTKYRPLSSNRIVSFGLGRNEDGMVLEAMKRIHMPSTTPYLSFQPLYGHNAWRSNDELVDALYDSRMITLLYPPIGTEVRSSSAAFALGISRPLVVTDTTWFRTVLDVFGRTGVWGVYAADNIGTLVSVIQDVLKLDDIEMEARFDMRIAAARQERMTLEQVVESHMNLYRSMT